MRHPSLEYALVFLIAVSTSFLLTPVARRIALRVGAVARPRDRDVHSVDTPRLGGLALFGGFLLTVELAKHLPSLSRAFHTSQVNGVLLAGVALCLLGVLDDRFELDSLTKLAGQITAAGVMVLVGGVQLIQFPPPWTNDNTFILGADNGVPLTILLTVLTINAVNFIDGLDGLAAGVTAISALAFFVFDYHLGQGPYFSTAAPPTLMAAVLAGACIGFLPHNFSPARIFMGDSGSMVVGLVLTAVAVTSVGDFNPALNDEHVFAAPLTLTLLSPLLVLALPLVDLIWAVVRRVLRGKSPFAPDKQHLHHRLMRLGHSHRRAVLLLWFWSALVGFGGVAMSMWATTSVFATLCALTVVGLVVSAIPTLRRSPQHG